MSHGFGTSRPQRLDDLGACDHVAVGGTVGPEPIDEHAPIRVLFIAGTGRSGSTLLAGILGQVPGVFNAGEVRYIWDRGLTANRLCGCGRPFRECPVWQEILDAAGPLDPSAMSSVQARLTRLRHLPGMAAGRGDLTGSAAGSYLSALGRLYRSIAAVTRSDVIVDASKLPSYGRLVGALPGVQLTVVQLVRDPRSAAASWTRIKEQPDRGTPGTMQRLSPFHSALLWNVWNSAAPRLIRSGSGRFMTLRYEDFVAEPRQTLERILELIGKPGATLPFIDPTTVDLQANHTVSGNPDRLKTGRITIRTDAGAPQRLHRRDEMLVTALTMPVLARFGYPARASSNGAHSRRVGIQHLPEPLRTWRRVERHLAWAREDGVGRLVEEDQLDPRERLNGALRRREWRRSHPIQPGSTFPVLLVGLQRSGTNMVARALEASPEFEVRNENDRAAFDRFRLRPLPQVRELVLRSRQRFLVLKPLIDSHRVDELLDGLGTPSAGRALWTYRSVDGRTRSALGKFGDHSLQVARAIALGRADVWQGERLSRDSTELVRSLDLEHMTPASAAALVWYLRNSLFFELGLDHRGDCLLVAYEHLIESPEIEIRRICAFLGAEFEPVMIARIERRTEAAPRLAIDPVVRQRCDELEQRLEEACSSLARS